MILIRNGIADPCITIFLAGVLAFVGGYLIEWLFAAAPCQLCLYQRYAYLSAAMLALLVRLYSCSGSIWRSLPLLSWVMLSGLTVFQYGVEQGWWRHQSQCTTPVAQGNSFELFMLQVQTADVVACDQPTFFFMQLSLAGWSLLYSLAVLLLVIISKRLVESPSKDNCLFPQL